MSPLAEGGSGVGPAERATIVRRQELDRINADRELLESDRVRNSEVAGSDDDRRAAAGRGAGPRSGPEPIVARPFPAHEFQKGSLLSRMLRTTDHKLIGRMYLVTSLIFFAVGGVMALLMRAELARPGMQFLVAGAVQPAVHDARHDHAAVLRDADRVRVRQPGAAAADRLARRRVPAAERLLLLAVPVRRAHRAVGGFLTPGGAADAGWTLYSPLTNEINSPGAGTDLWIIGLAVAGLGTILGGVNMVTTVITLRAPGMTMFRMPIFTWNILVTSLLVLLAFPILTAALLVLWIDRHMGAQVFDGQNGGAILWQHLFWFFGHPEVYIIALPFFGIITEVIPVFSRKPLFGYKGMVFATLSIAALSLTVWAHHMFTTGAVLLPFFSLMTFLIAVPTGIKFFNWIGSMWRGAVTFETPMMFALGFMVTFLFGGLTGVLLASPPIDFHVADSYFVVAHFHYVLFGTIVFAVYSGIYFWFPKFTGRYLDEKLGKVHFWLTFIGFHATFLVQHWLGAEGMPRRYADYLPSDGFTTLNTVSTIGSFVLGASFLPFVYNMYRTYRFGEIVTADDPWGYGNSLEWATSTPAAAAQLHLDPAHPLRAAGVRAPLPAPAGAARGRGARRSPAPQPRRGAGRRRGVLGRAARRATATRIRATERTPRRRRDAAAYCLVGTAPVMRPTSVLATVTGRDRPGVTAAFFAALAAHDVDVRDVEQVVIRDRLILTVLFDLRGDPAALRNSVTRAAGALGMECEIDDRRRRRLGASALPGTRSHVIVLGHPLRPGAVSHVAQRIADVGGNIESVTQLSTEPVAALEMLVRDRRSDALRAALVAGRRGHRRRHRGRAGRAAPAGEAARRARRRLDLDPRRGRRRARRAGRRRSSRSARSPRAPMAGELDFRRRRCARGSALLAGLPDGAGRRSTCRGSAQRRRAPTFVAHAAAAGLPRRRGERRLHGVTDAFVAELGLDFAAANELEIVDGGSPGGCAAPIVDRPGQGRGAAAGSPTSSGCR